MILMKSKLQMKLGDLIRWRQDWIHANHEYDENGVAIKWDVLYPRTDDEGWSDPCLVVEELEPNLWVCLYRGQRIVVGPKEGLTAVEIIGLAHEIEELAMNFAGD